MEETEDGAPTDNQGIEKTEDDETEGTGEIGIEHESGGEVAEAVEGDTLTQEKDEKLEPEDEKQLEDKIDTEGGVGVNSDTEGVDINNDMEGVDINNDMKEEENEQSANVYWNRLAELMLMFGQ